MRKLLSCIAMVGLLAGWGLAAEPIICKISNASLQLYAPYAVAYCLNVDTGLIIWTVGPSAIANQQDKYGSIEVTYWGGKYGPESTITPLIPGHTYSSMRFPLSKDAVWTLETGDIAPTTAGYVARIQKFEAICPTLTAESQNEKPK